MATFYVVDFAGVDVFDAVDVLSPLQVLVFRSLDVHFDHVLLSFPHARSALHACASGIVVVVRSVTFPAALCLSLQISQSTLRMVVLAVLAVAQLESTGE